MEPRPELWLALAVLAYIVMGMCVIWALRPKPIDRQAYPDWFYQGGTWTRSDQPGIVHGQYESFKPEQTDRPESEPESGAG